MMLKSFARSVGLLLITFLWSLCDTLRTDTLTFDQRPSAYYNNQVIHKHNHVMITRIFAVSFGIFLILLILFFRGLPVLILLKMFPLIALFLLAVAFIIAGIMSDSN
jgi:hypothetical protein